MTNEQLDQLAINTIRTLSIDAVQQAKSGHPGTPMALAPLVYTIWNRVMRFDPQDPIWPNRDRFVLSNGHASMLLWSVLHLTGTQAVNADYERLGQPSVTLDDIRHFRQLDSKAPGHPEYHWVSGVETTTGPLGQGVATSVGMAIAQKWLAHRYNRPGFDIFDYNIYAVCGDGCLMEGVGVGGGVAGRPSGPGQPLLGLRQQPHHHRGQHAHHLHGGRRGPFPGLRLERPARGRRQRHRSHRARPGGLPADEGPPHLHHSGQPHRLRLPAQAGHRRRPTASRSAKRRSASCKRSLRLARGREVPRPRRRPRAFRRRHRRARRGGPAAVDGTLRRLPGQVPRTRHRDRPDAAARAAGRLGPQSARLPGRPEGHRRARRLGQGAERAGAEHPLVPGRLGRPGAVEQDHPEVRGRGRFPGRQPRREEPAFRHPRARHGGDRERAVAVQAPGLRRDLLHLQRLRPARHPALGPDGAAHHLRLHARRHGRRRGRPDAPAGGAAGVVARHPRAGHAAARRRQRGRRGLPLHHAAAPPAGRAGRCRASRCRRSTGASMRRPPAWRAAPTCWPTPPAEIPR